MENNKFHNRKQIYNKLSSNQELQKTDNINQNRLKENTLIFINKNQKSDSLNYLYNIRYSEKISLFECEIIIETNNKIMKLAPVLLMKSDIFKLDKYKKIKNINEIINLISIISQTSDNLKIYYKELKLNNLSNIKYLILDLTKIFHLQNEIQKITQNISGKKPITYAISSNSSEVKIKELCIFRNILSHATGYKIYDDNKASGFSNKLTKFIGYHCLEINNDRSAEVKVKLHNLNQLLVESFVKLNQWIDAIFELHLKSNYVYKLNKIKPYYIDIIRDYPDHQYRHHLIHNNTKIIL